jgi:hypothetical protein
VFCVHLHLLWRDSLFIIMIVAVWIESVVGKVAIRRAGQKPTKHIHPIRDTPPHLWILLVIFIQQNFSYSLLFGLILLLGLIPRSVGAVWVNAICLAEPSAA